MPLNQTKPNNKKKIQFYEVSRWFFRLMHLSYFRDTFNFKENASIYDRLNPAGLRNSDW